MSRLRLIASFHFFDFVGACPVTPPLTRLRIRCDAALHLGAHVAFVNILFGDLGVVAQVMNVKEKFNYEEVDCQGLIVSKREQLVREALAC